MFREVWRDIPGYEGLYQVSDLGRVKSLNYNHTGREQIRRPGKGRNGYLQVGLWKDGKVKWFKVHRLVWIAFNGPIPDGYEINHISEDKTDCRLVNLNLMTHKENLNWGTGNRRRSKMVEQHTLDGTHICTWFSTIGIEKELGYSQGHISKCCNLKKHFKTAYGYIWKYAESPESWQEMVCDEAD